jgi:predicted  nucleic acid-binding Zn-ribbon protein
MEQRKDQAMDDQTLTQIKNTLQRELERLREAREELRLQSTLARADMRTEWERLETRFHLAQEEVVRLGEHTKSAAHEIEVRARELFEEIKAGYERIRRAA